MTITMQPTPLSAKQLYNKGSDIQADQHKAAEGGKIGTLRGGNTGALVNGDVIGKCHRRSMARFLGFSEPKDESSQFFFDGGFANEDTWLKKLQLSWPGPIRCEEDYPLSWTVPGTDIKVTGRPDVVLFTEDGDDTAATPVLGLELKSIMAFYSAIDIAVHDKPKTDHLLQAAHYSWALGIPYILVYNWNIRAAGGVKGQGYVRIDPGSREYRLGWDEGQLYYIKEDGSRVDTDITQQSIVDYYSLVADMAASKDLYRLVADKGVHGEPAPYSQCNYCPFKAACDKTDNFDNWVDQVRLITEEGGS